MTYHPDPDKSVRERVIAFLKYIEEAVRPAEIAEAIDASQSYLYGVLSDLHDEGVVEKHHGRHIVGHPMPDGGSVVLPGEKDKLLDIIAKYDPSLLDTARDLEPHQIRTLIESEIAVGDPHPMGNRKVYYSYSGESGKA